jgi:DNA topoisomerase-1
VAKEARRFVPTDLGELVVKLLKEHFREIIDVSFTADMEEQLDQIADGDEDWKEVLRAFYEPFHSTVEYAEKIMPAVEIPPEVTDEKCEICGRNLVVKEGRFGKFLACPGYPECKFTKPYLPDTGAKCPKCGGAIVERRSKKGRLFYGCKNYPSCDFVVWNRPTKETCPQCGTFLVEKTSRGKTVLTCGNPECGYHVEREEKPAEEG